MLVRCKYCQKHFNIEEKNSFEIKDPGEKEFLQKEILRLEKRIENLQYKHDYENLSNYKFYRVCTHLSVLRQIKDLMERYL